MTNYKKGTIYKIICAVSDDVYIGSTFSTCRNRWQNHKGTYNNWLSNNKNRGCSIYPYFKKYGIENFKLIKIKEYDCVDRIHLESKEQLWISKTKCVNKLNPLHISYLYKKKWNTENKEKIKQQKTTHYENNKDKIKERSKKRYEEKKEEIKKQTKEYREQNKEKRKEYAKEYIENNKEEIKKKKAIKHICKCGGSWNNGHGFKRHEKTKKHQTFINH